MKRPVPPHRQRGQAHEHVVVRLEDVDAPVGVVDASDAELVRTARVRKGKELAEPFVMGQVETADEIDRDDSADIRRPNCRSSKLGVERKDLGFRQYLVGPLPSSSSLNMSSFTATVKAVTMAARKRQ